MGLDKTFGGEGFSRPEDGINEYANLAEAAEKLIKRMDEQRIKTAMIVVVPSFRDGPDESYRQMRDRVRKHPDRLRLLAGGSLLGPTLQETDPGEVTDEIKRDFRKTAEMILDEGAAGFGEMMVYHLCMNPNHSFQEVAGQTSR